ncbi:MAG: hypothetical protein NT015_12090 [Alphaproteobacteria bacterium]|nr:hypothetical protein [Alphaproteobacteria bacterium]
MRGFLIILALIGLIAGGAYSVRTYAPQYLPDEWTTDAVLRERMRDELRTDARADAFFTKFEALFPADYNELLNSIVTLRRRRGTEAQARQLGESYMRSFIEDNQRYVALAEGPALVDLTRAIAAGTHALRAENPTACGEMFRSGGGFNMNVDTMSEPTQDAFMGITLAMLDGIASGKRTPTVHPAPTQAQALAWVNRFEQLGGDTAVLEAIGSSDIYGASPDKVCDTANYMWTSALQAEDDFVARFISLSVRMRTGGQP